MVAYSFKKRFISPIQLGLQMKVDPKHRLVPVADLLPKTQTIRAEGKRRHARKGETLQLYQSQRTKQCFLIGTAPCRSVESIELLLKNNSIDVKIEGFKLKSKQIDEFVREDGFKDVADMLDFWKTEHPGVTDFRGFLIKWMPK